MITLHYAHYNSLFDHVVSNNVYIIVYSNVDVIFCLSFSPTSDGAACAILASEDFVHRHNLQSQAIQIIGQAMHTDFPSTFNENSCMKMVSS